MAVQEPVDDGSGTEYEKVFDVVAYANDSNKSSKEDFAAVMTGEPTNEKEKVETENWKVEIDLGGDVIENSIRYWNAPNKPLHEIREEGYDDRDEWQEHYINQKIAEINTLDSNLVTATHETVVEEEYKTSAHQAGRKFLDEDVSSWLPDELEDNMGWDEFHHWFSVEDSVKQVRISSQGFDEQRVLAKESERDSDDLYETMSERPCFRIQITMKSDEEGDIDKWTEQVVPVIHKGLARNEAVGVVRYMSCEVTETKKGECYNL